MPPIISTVVTAVISSVVGAVVAAALTKVKEAAELKEMMRQNILMTCRLTIYNDHFSVDEKLDAYIIYRDTCHANHQTKTYMDDLVGCDVDDYLQRHGR